MKKKRIRLPQGMDSSVLKRILESRPGVVATNWVFQGMRYMNPYERLYRLILECAFILGAFLICSRFMGFFISLSLSLILIHTLFWIANGHLFVLMRYVSSHRNDPLSFINYVEKMRNRMGQKDFLLGAAAFGSLSKGRFSETSDFDMRLIRRKEAIPSIRAFNLCTTERLRALVNRFPLDIYVFDVEDLRSKIKPDEPPIVMAGPERVFKEIYEDVKTFEDFHSHFIKAFVEK